MVFGRIKESDSIKVIVGAETQCVASLQSSGGKIIVKLFTFKDYLST
jgi:hypothetical protein